MSIRLRRGLFLSGGTLYRPGDVLPETAGARALVGAGSAEEDPAPVPTPAPPKPVRAAKPKAPAPEEKGPEEDGTGDP